VTAGNDIQLPRRFHRPRWAQGGSRDYAAPHRGPPKVRGPRFNRVGVVGSDERVQAVRRARPPAEIDRTISRARAHSWMPRRRRSAPGVEEPCNALADQSTTTPPRFLREHEDAGRHVAGGGKVGPRLALRRLTVRPVRRTDRAGRTRGRLRNDGSERPPWRGRERWETAARTDHRIPGALGRSRSRSNARGIGP